MTSLDRNPSKSPQVLQTSGPSQALGAREEVGGVFLVGPQVPALAGRVTTGGAPGRQRELGY